MNKRERFLNVLANKPVDRVPVAMFHHFTTYEEWLTGLERPDVFEKNIEGHRISREVFDPDVIKVMNDSLMLMPVDVSGVKCAKDMLKIKLPTMDSPFMQKTKELTIRALEFYKDSEAPKYVTGFSPAMVLRSSMGGSDRRNGRQAEAGAVSGGRTGNLPGCPGQNSRNNYGTA